MKTRHNKTFEAELARIASKLESDRSAASDTDQPSIIYHYTDPKGLIGILSEGQLWATDIRYLNDSSELRHAEEVHRKFLEELIAQFPETSSQRTLATETGNRKSMLNDSFDTYVVCFCSIDDLVTQWSTYASRGAGFSIGFDRRRLAEWIQPPQPKADVTNWSEVELRPYVRLAKVIYSEQEQRREFKRAFDAYHAAFISATTFPKKLQRCARRIVDNVASSASRFKHPCFQSEEEWRIIVSTMAGGSNLSFRSSSRTVVPYVALPFEKKPLPIVSITVGPTLNQDLSERSVRALLFAHKYNRVATDGIKLSKLPLVRTD